MNKHPKIVVAFFAVIAAFHLLIGFVVWDWDAGNWTLDARKSFAVLVACVGAFCAFIASPSKEEKP